VVLISGCASFKEPLKGAFVAKGTRLYAGWITTMSDCDAIGPMKTFLKELLGGKSIAEAKRLADLQIPTTLNSQRIALGCDPVGLEAYCAGSLSMNLYELLDLPNPNE
jgi:hypothetical protein